MGWFVGVVGDGGHLFGHELGGVVGDDTGVYEAVADGFECGDNVVDVSAVAGVHGPHKLHGDVIGGGNVVGE